MTGQKDLFEAAAGPDGLSYRLGFLSAPEEAELLEVFAALPLEEAQYKEWRAKRRIVSYGGRYDFNENELRPAGPIPRFLYLMRERLAAWAGIPASGLEHAVVAEYRPGTQLGWHRDVPTFETVLGVSLGGFARMRFRPYPPRSTRRAAFALDLEPRSAYILSGAARWAWQHAISPTKTLRYSVTFRTLRARPEDSGKSSTED
ncbi:MAG TPA: alpha-ketoglutarate-dependent dioxygenase AlkB [Gammaproteobacteria bacterium]|nr:alpha-ketoglutarate-dependent dioxygenase AlkB [Gammaproteobacteria bacterium]